MDNRKLVKQATCSLGLGFQGLCHSLGFRVSGLGFMFRVSGLGFRVDPEHPFSWEFCPM